MENIKENLNNIRENIKRAALKSGRTEDDILLLGVTKTIDADRVNRLVDLGVTSLGENRVQELTEKYDKVSNSVDWHLIGNLQTNKVKYVIDKVAMIHSVDRIKLAEEINRRAKEKDVAMKVLVEINIGQEESKHGISIKETENFIYELSKFPNIRVSGLMTVAPFVENPQENREYFQEIHEKFIDIKAKNIDNVSMDFISMGMTNDYEVAIEEGANIVRIGTGIFGKRNYNI